MDVLLAITQGGHDDGNGTETVVKVLPEFPGAYGLQDVNVRGGNDPHIGLQNGRRTDTDEFTGLQHPEKPDLGRQGQFRHLVEKDRTPVHHFEISFPGFVSAGEGPFLVSEKLRINGPFRDRAAVHSDIGSVFSRTQMVDDLREKLFPRARFSRDQNRDVGGLQPVVQYQWHGRETVSSQ